MGVLILECIKMDKKILVLLKENFLSKDYKKVISWTRAKELQKKKSLNYAFACRGTRLSMSYEKDIFAVFAYEFELSLNRWFLVKSFACAHGEIIYSVNCEI